LQEEYNQKALAQFLLELAIFLRTATKNKKLLAGGILSESSRPNCDVANLVTTAKKTQCDDWKYQKALKVLKKIHIRLDDGTGRMTVWAESVTTAKKTQCDDWKYQKALKVLKKIHIWLDDGTGRMTVWAKLGVASFLIPKQSKTGSRVASFLIPKSFHI
jgi:hypothetical protein